MIYGGKPILLLRKQGIKVANLLDHQNQVGLDGFKSLKQRVGQAGFETATDGL